MTAPCRLQLARRNWFGKLMKSRHEKTSWQELEQLALRAAQERPVAFDLSCDTLASEAYLVLDRDRALGDHNG